MKALDLPAVPREPDEVLEPAEEANTVIGLWSWLLHTGILPFNGVFMGYNDAYIVALWKWLKGAPHPDRDPSRTLNEPEN